MLIILEKNLKISKVKEIIVKIEKMGIHPRLISAANQSIIEIPEGNTKIDDKSFNFINGITQIVKQSSDYPLADKKNHPEKTIIKIADLPIGSGDFALIAGPCAVESEQQLLKTAFFLAEQGVKMLRAGAFKPRTSPYSFQGLGIAGLKILKKIKSETAMHIVTEAMDVISISNVAEIADIIQIGTRNMQNFPLLKRAGQLNKPVLLKRGMSSTIKELLLAAEYILGEGNPDVILCERGIRAFDNYSRTFLDLGAVPVLDELTHLPVIVDPSHAAGYSQRVAPLSRASLAVGADGLMVEVHPDPATAKSDGLQSITFRQFLNLKKELEQIATALNRKVL